MNPVARSINGGLRRIPAWPLYLIALLPPVWLYYQGLTGQLGVDPVKSIERELGQLSLQVFIAVLAVTPLRRFTDINLIRYRRALGLICFFYVLVHLLTWLFLDIQLFWGQIWADILKRPYITIGMFAFVVMIPLAVTSNNRAIRKLGPKSWGRIHQLTYLAVFAGGVHFVMVRKGWQLEPIIYLTIITALLALRLLPRRRKPAPARAAA
ncbi:protein-methionine-sulfoxide reductase heme-binding subunit MsrQ [Brevirhabdus sp.]|uniref:protein-methionine-sulfoxide reductase heme-binding subunit MsrQ n=1 Tax=Brevirhabdus sp. TaxID=2004514 RepID=UPI0040594737